MQWLLHGTLTPAVADALRRHGHSVHAVADLSLEAGADPGEILRAARRRQWDVITNDPAFVRAPFDLDLWFERSIVFLQLAGGDVEQDDAVDRLFKRYKRLTPRRLYSVTETRVKVRQLPAPGLRPPRHDDDGGGPLLENADSDADSDSDPELDQE